MAVGTQRTLQSPACHVGQEEAQHPNAQRTVTSIHTKRPRGQQLAHTRSAPLALCRLRPLAPGCPRPRLRGTTCVTVALAPPCCTPTPVPLLLSPAPHKIRPCPSEQPYRHRYPLSLLVLCFPTVPPVQQQLCMQRPREDAVRPAAGSFYRTAPAPTCRSSDSSIRMCTSAISGTHSVSATCKPRHDEWTLLRSSPPVHGWRNGCAGVRSALMAGQAQRVSQRAAHRAAVTQRAARHPPLPPPHRHVPPFRTLFLSLLGSSSSTATSSASSCLRV